MSQVQPAPQGRVVGTLSCQKDSYLLSYDAKVLSCTPAPPPAPPPASDPTATKAKGKKSNIVTTTTTTPSWLIEFDDSVLFPEGGGQPTDHGTLTPLTPTDEDKPNVPIPVTFVERKGLRCIIHSPQPLDPGTSIRQEIDFTRRWDLMQQHTGQHLLSAVMDTYENLHTLGWGMGAAGEMSYVDLPRKPTELELAAIQVRVNELIAQNLSVTVRVVEDAKTTKLPGDYDTSQGVVRVVSIGDLDNNTCCGTHLRQTSHISLILLGPSTAASSNRTRQFFIAGTRAITLASTSTTALRTLARTLSVSSDPSSVLTSISTLQSSLSASRKREAKLLADLAEVETERVRDLLRRGRNAFVWRAGLSTEFVNTVVFGVRGKIGPARCVVLVAEEGGAKGGGSVAVVCRVGEAREVLDRYVAMVKEKVQGIKGGGKGERWQGKVGRLQEMELLALKEVVESDGDSPSSA